MGKIVSCIFQVMMKLQQQIIVFSQTNAGFYYFSFKKNIIDITEKGTQLLPAMNVDESVFFKYTASKDEALSMFYDNSEYEVKVFCLDTGENILLKKYDNEYQLLCSAGNTYYIEFKNRLSTVHNVSQWVLQSIERLNISELYEGIVISDFQYYNINIPASGYYEISEISKGLSVEILGKTQFNGKYYLEANDYVVCLKGNTLSGKFCYELCLFQYLLWRRLCRTSFQ